MSLFFYYTWHSFVNQIKKLFKTWLAILIAVCFILGIGIGLFAVMLEDKAAESETGTLLEEVIEEEAPFADRLYEKSGLTVPRFAELIGGAAALALLLLFTLTSDNSDASLFLPADTVLLFSSPLKPQRVLRFRIMGKLGLALFMTVYFCIEIPMMKEWGMSTLTAFSVILSFGLCFAAGMLLQAIAFLLADAHPFIKKNLTYLCLGLVALVAAVFFVYYRSSGQSLPLAADAFFNSRAARCFPLWGWIKSVPFLLWEGKNGLAAASLAAAVAGIALLVVLADLIRADFYEEAITRAEHYAQTLEKMKANGGLFAGRKTRGEKKKSFAAFGKGKSSPFAAFGKKKDSEDEDGGMIAADGEAASGTVTEKEYKDCVFKAVGPRIFFDKPMALRRRFAKLGFLTKRSGTYLVLAILGMLAAYFFFDLANVIAAAVPICAWVFFSTLGNPLLADVKTPYFRMAPGSGNAKMFWSVLAGSANCLLDVLPGMGLGCVLGIVLGQEALQALGLTLAGILFAASLDFYSANVGAFIQLSLPEHAGSTLKQTVQILFLYFGLLPDIGVLAYGAVSSEGLDGFIPYLFITVGLNFLLGLFFMAFSPLFLWPASRSRADMDLQLAPADCRKEKKFFSRMGFGIALLLAAATLGQFLLGMLSGFLPGNFADSQAYFWISSFVPIYAIGIPCAWLVLKKLPARPLEKHGMNVLELLKFFVVADGLAYIANLIGNLIVLPTYYFAGAEYENVVETLTAQGELWVQILVIVVIGPFFEELVFRKILIDRLNVYGGRLAVFTSALAFGLFHGNIQQMLYAAVIGFVFGYVYQKTGRLVYSWILHMLVNFNGSIVAMKILDYGVDSWMVTAYLIALVCFVLSALVISAVGFRKLRFVRGEKLLPKGSRFRTVWLNSGMIVMVIVCLAMAVYNVAAAI